MKLYLLLLIIALLDQWFLGSALYIYIVAALILITIYRFVDALGKKICFIEIIGIIGVLIYLALPTIFYLYYNEENTFARTYKATMPIKADAYFSYALPGTLMLLIGLSTHLVKQKMSDYQLIQACKDFLSDKKFLGILLIIAGLSSAAVLPFAPSVIRAVVYYMSQLTFVGFLYLLHTNTKGKGLLILAALAILIGQSALTAMYGELVFWSVLGLIVLSIGAKYKMAFKILLIFLGAGFVLLVQSVKHEYRLVMQSGYLKGSKPARMIEIAQSRILEPESVIQPIRVFGMAMRMNQGFLVARTMKYVPKREPYANGETIGTSIAASLLPRLVWRDKPEAGGSYMICRFLGDCRKLEYSYNIGQLGEAYVNFGRFGGVLFMFLYGFFIRASYTWIANLSVKRTTLILWTPLLFFASLSLETDVLTYVNSYVKAVFFCFLVFGGSKLLYSLIRK